jgi:glyoxalase-like protein
MNATVALTSCAVAATFVSALSTPSRPERSVPLHAQFDHLVVAIRSLPEGIAAFERLTGVTPGIGGQHPGRGTENALVSLGGGSYLEVIAPQKDATLSGQDAPMRGLDHLTIINWAVSVSDVDAAVAALKAAGFEATPPQPGARVTPAGDRLEWTTFGLGDRSVAVAPFFIHWSAGTKHPSTTAPGGCTLGSLAVRDPSGHRLASALEALAVGGVTVGDGPVRIEAILKCGSKTATLTTP